MQLIQVDGGHAHTTNAIPTALPPGGRDPPTHLHSALPPGLAPNRQADVGGCSPFGAVSADGRHRPPDLASDSASSPTVESEPGADLTSQPIASEWSLPWPETGPGCPSALTTDQPELMKELIPERGECPQSVACLGQAIVNLHATGVS